jgi:hypothetical protein
MGYAITPMIGVPGSRSGAIVRPQGTEVFADMEIGDPGTREIGDDRSPVRGQTFAAKSSDGVVIAGVFDDGGVESVQEFVVRLSWERGQDIVKWSFDEEFDSDESGTCGNRFSSGLARRPNQQKQRSKPMTKMGDAT